ncbi:Chromosome partition protein smc [Giardia duodenalis]|uniref:Structural maintenance of chromosomes protein n=1 Tax=Giardia intestinalis TaxID=5741 RepID=V6TQ43_GIAIN|nr:Chromosome partition protein smc [Giardia intestinalis]
MARYSRHPTEVNDTSRSTVIAKKKLALMYLSEVEIKNFRSIVYASVTGLHPGINVFVGINGAGKSNFYGAILFALMDPLYDLKTINRAQVLSNDATNKSGYVKLILDLEGVTVGDFQGKVSVSRHFTITTDTFYLNDVLVTSDKVANFLSIMGFNPSSQGYTFDIRQSKVTSLAMSSPKALLDAFNSSTGTWEYDTRKQDALEKLKAARTEREEAQQIYMQLKGRCSRLTERMNKNKEYLKLMAERKAAEHALATLTYNAFQEQHTRLSAQKDALIDDCKAKRVKIDAIRAEVNGLTSELTPLQLQESSALAAERVLDDRIYYLIDSCQYLGSFYTAKSQKSQDQEDSVKARRCSAQDTLEEAISREASLLLELSKLRNAHYSLSSSIRKQRIILEDHGPSKRESLVQELGDISQNLINAETEHAAVNSLLKEVAQELECVSKKLEVHKAREAEINADKLLQKHVELSERRQRLNMDLSVQIKSLNEAESKVVHEEYQLSQLTREFLDLAPANLASGANLCLSAIKEAKISGFKGFLAEHISAAVGSYPALESAIGATGLYSLLVEKRETAAEIMRHVRQGSSSPLSGKANFIVLDAISPPHLQDIDSNCVPLASLVSTADETRPAIQQALGVSYLTRSLEDAAKYSSEHNIDCYTITGDVIQGSGVAVGGHRNFKRLKCGVSLGISREALLKASLVKGRVNTEIEKIKQELRRVTAELAELEPSVSPLQEELGEIHTDVLPLSEEFTKLQKNKAKLQIDEQDLRVRIDTLTQAKQSVEASLSSLAANSKLSSMQMKSLRKELVDKEANEKEIERKIDAIQALVNKAAVDRMKAEARMQNIEASVTHSELGIKEKDDIEAQMTSLLTGLERANLEALEFPSEEAAIGLLITNLVALSERLKSAIGDKEELDVIAQLSAKFLSALTELSDSMKAAVTSYKEATNWHKQKIADKEAEIEDLNRELEAAAMRFEAIDLENNDALQHYKKADVALREISTPTADAMEALQREKAAAKVSDEQERSWLVSYIAAKSQQMGETPPISQRAIDQYDRAVKEKDQLEKQLADVVEGEHAVEELIAKLDDKRKAHFEEQFKAVNMRFSEIFRRITGNEAHLTLSVHGDGEPDGILIDATFANQATKDVQMSGGQRTLTSLCFVLAAEQVSGNSFLLLDEPDACLDEAYRTVFASLLVERATQGIQMFIVTFRTEIITAANQCFAVGRVEEHTMIEPVPNAYALSVAADAATVGLLAEGRTGKLAAV